MVNIFGGIVDCSIVADGIVTAYESLKLDVPIVVRLEGNIFFPSYFHVI